MCYNIDMNLFKKIILALLTLEAIGAGIIAFKLAKNNSFFSGKYSLNKEQTIEVPKYSYYKSVDNTGAKFVSPKTQSALESEIQEYLNSYEKVSNRHGDYYKKDDIIIKNYKVEDCGLYRRITIEY